MATIPLRPSRENKKVIYFFLVIFFLLLLIFLIVRKGSFNSGISQNEKTASANSRQINVNFNIPEIQKLDSMAPLEKVFVPSKGIGRDNPFLPPQISKISISK